MRNVRLDQEPDGNIPIIVPMPPPCPPAFAALEVGESGANIRSAAGWGDAITFIPVTLWRRHGDIEALRVNYPALQAWVELQRRQAAANPARLAGVTLAPRRLEHHRLLWNAEPNFGDWLAPSITDASDFTSIMNAPLMTGEHVGAMFAAQSLTLIAETADALGREAEAEDYRHRVAAAAPRSPPSTSTRTAACRSSSKACTCSRVRDGNEPGVEPVAVGGDQVHEVADEPASHRGGDHTTSRPVPTSSPSPAANSRSPSRSPDGSGCERGYPRPPQTPT